MAKKRWFWRGSVEMSEARSRALTQVDTKECFRCLDRVEMGEARSRALTRPRAASLVSL